MVIVKTYKTYAKTYQYLMPKTQDIPRIVKTKTYPMTMIEK